MKRIWFEGSGKIGCSLQNLKQSLENHENFFKGVVACMSGIVLECDEEYQAGRMVTARSHYFDEFLKTENGISHRTVISEVSASGLLGFFYRKFGSRSIGKAD